ncbi:MAG: EamA family transporter [Nodosilinea sp.]
MGPSDHLPNSSAPQPDPPSAEVVLRVLGHDLEALRHQVTGYLSSDIARLQARKQRLMADVEALEGDYEALQRQHQQLQSTYAEGLSQQQTIQQQAWAKRLAVALATHLQGQLETALAKAHSSILQTSSHLDAVSPSATAIQSLAALDTTLQGTLTSLQQDLTSYHSSLSQQINRMQSVEQQGEAILEALVARLSQQLQGQMTPPPVRRSSTPPRNGLPGATLPLSPDRTQSPGIEAPAARDSLSVSPTTTPRATQARPQLEVKPSSSGDVILGTGNPSQNQLQVGLLMVVLSTLALSIHNVIVGIIGYGGQILGRIPVEAVLPLTIPNSLLLLWLRMVVVVPLLALAAPRLYPRVGSDLRQLLQSSDRRPLAQVVASGGFLFLSQVLIYKAIADVGPGVAVTLLFMYPLITVPLAWFLFGDRPTPLRLVVMFAISMGIVFTALPRIYQDITGSSVSLWGVGAALLASIAFALFLVAMQLSFKRLHPVPVSLLQFSTIFILTSLILVVGTFFGLEPSQPSQPLQLYIGAGLLGLLTLLGYLFNNYGVKLLGASQASIVAASGPVATALLAYFITPGEKSTLLFIQWMGVILVTLGVISLSLERLTSQRRQAKQRSAVPANTGQWH